MEAEDIQNGIPLPRELEPMVEGNGAPNAPELLPEPATQPTDSEMLEAPRAQDTRAEIDSKDNIEPSGLASDGFLLVEKDDAPEGATAATNGDEVGGSNKTPAKGTAVKKNSTPRSKVDYDAGTLVTIKLKGYPPWPGMVVTDDFVPPSVLTQKPHPPKGKKKKEEGEETADAKPIAPIAWPVLFFADNNYMWATRSDLKLLSKEAAEASSNKGRDRQLRAAYAIAASTPTLEEAKALEPYVDDMADEMDDDEDGEKKGKKRKKVIDSDEDGEVVGTKRSKSKRKSSTVGGFTAINGDDDDDAPSIKRKPSSARKDKKKESAKDMAEAREKRERDLLYLRHRLQKVFLARDKAATDEEVDSMDDILRMLENFAELDAALIRKTKINKVLRGIIRLDSVPKDEQYKYSQRAQTLLTNWSPMLEGANGDEGQKEEGKEQPVSDDQPAADVAMTDEKDMGMPAPDVGMIGKLDAKESAGVPAVPAPEQAATNGSAPGAQKEEQ